MSAYIKKEDLENFCAYICDARNFEIGIWYDGKMYGIRHKFCDSYIDTEFHYDDGAKNCGTCKPLVKLTASLKDRLHPSIFEFDNWRGEFVLHDILFALNSITNVNLLKNSILLDIPEEVKTIVIYGHGDLDFYDLFFNNYPKYDFIVIDDTLKDIRSARLFPSMQEYVSAFMSYDPATTLVVFNAEIFKSVKYSNDIEGCLDDIWNDLDFAKVKYITIKNIHSNPHDTYPVTTKDEFVKYCTKFEEN